MAAAWAVVYSVAREDVRVGQLLVMLIVPPIVGVMTYVVIGLVSKSDEDASDRVVPQRWHSV